MTKYTFIIQSKSAHSEPLLLYILLYTNERKKQNKITQVKSIHIKCYYLIYTMFSSNGSNQSHIATCIKC